jgi:hypothetical protein
VIYEPPINPSNFTPMTNLFEQPVGRSVLVLNNLHFGKHLDALNRCARLVPDYVKGFATLVVSTPYMNDVAKDDVIRMLIGLADEADPVEHC